jgi:hypothetical protein
MCWIPAVTNLATSLVTSSLRGIYRITNQLSVNLNFIKRVGTCPLFHLLAILAQLITCILATRLLDLIWALLHACMHACTLYAGKTVRERGNLPILIMVSNKMFAVRQGDGLDKWHQLCPG